MPDEVNVVSVEPALLPVALSVPPDRAKLAPTAIAPATPVVPVAPKRCSVSLAGIALAAIGVNPSAAVTFPDDRLIVPLLSVMLEPTTTPPSVEPVAAGSA